MRFSRSLLIWTLFCALAGAVFLAYALASLAAGRGQFVMPLDDVYIHFQYAKQMANGQPYVYNPGQPPTSGATSFLYPFVLAAGYLIGFQGLNLGLWAMIVGALALLGTLWLVYKTALAFDSPDWLAVMTALIFGLTGAVNWHFMSGMETGLMTLFTLATLYAVVTGRFRLFIVAASLMALTRPEGGILAVIAVMTAFLWARSDAPPLPGKRLRWLLVPILAIFVQPAVNLIVTGSVVATGNSAKSLFGMVPFYWDVVLGRIRDNFVRMWVEFTTGVSPREGLYLPWLVGPLAFLALIVALFRRDRWRVSLMVILWLLAGTAALSTLDTAFWHFKRYQIPLMALFFPLAAWTISRMAAWARTHGGAPLRFVISALVGIGFVVALTTSAAFLHHFALNVDYVYLQPLQMARWLGQNTPEGALIAVHDVGMMRYIGGRNTLDMVGLTTPGAAAYWRNGPGSIAEFLMRNRPDYIAAYGEGHGLGLGMIARTSIYGQPLAEFPVVLDDHFNVALAANYQGIYKPDWDSEIFSRLHSSLQASDYEYNVWGPESALDIPSGNVNVGDVEDEAYDNYSWSNGNRLTGFPTDVFELDYVSCAIENCLKIDAGRRITGEESFSLLTGYSDSGSAWDIVLVTRLQPVSAGTIDVYANGEFMGTRWIPEIPGKWLEIATLIPKDVAWKQRFSTNRIDIRIVPHMGDGYYMPFYHWIYGVHHDRERPETEIASYQNGGFILSNVNIDNRLDLHQLDLGLQWYTDGSAKGDYRFFAHLYKDISQPPVAQHDDYPGNGTLPPGNWLPGVLHDQVVVDLSDVAPGTYKLAIGFYNPYTGERLMPESDVDEVSPDGRLWLGEVEVPAAN